MDIVQAVIIALVVTALLGVGCRVIFAAWFEAKARYVEHLHTKLGERGDKNATD
jgi:hypothetical protein